MEDGLGEEDIELLEQTRQDDILSSEDKVLSKILELLHEISPKIIKLINCWKDEQRREKILKSSRSLRKFLRNIYIISPVTSYAEIEEILKGFLPKSSQLLTKLKNYNEGSKLLLKVTAIKDYIYKIIGES